MDNDSIMGFGRRPRGFIQDAGSFDIAGFIEDGMQHYSAALFDRVMDDPALVQPAPGTLDTLMASIARDLEALLNTRTALSAELLAPHPEVAASVANYGLIDFAGMCLTSDTDQKAICAAVQLAIERHEPRLRNINAALRLQRSGINRIDFVITAQIRVRADLDPVEFNAVLEPSTQQYSIRNRRP